MKEFIKDLELLRTPAEPLTFISDTGINDAEGKEIIKDLKEILEANKNLLAISAPQIGVNKRIFCIKFNDIIKTFINPIIIKKSGSIIAPETLSIMPGKEFLLARPKEITCVYYTDEFKYEENKLLDLAARIFDQQIQLLDGVFPSDIGLVSEPDKDGSIFEATDEEMQQLIELYKQFISAKTKAAKDNIDKDKELQEQFKKLKLTEDVINGRTLVIQNTQKLNRAQRRQLAKNAKKMAHKNKNK